MASSGRVGDRAPLALQQIARAGIYRFARRMRLEDRVVKVSGRGQDFAIPRLPLCIE